MIEKYKKKPIVVEVVRFMPKNEEQLKDIIKFTNNKLQSCSVNDGVLITTKGNLRIFRGDYIIKDGKDLYVRDFKSFKKYYDEVVE